MSLEVVSKAGPDIVARVVDQVRARRMAPMVWCAAGAAGTCVFGSAGGGAVAAPRSCLQVRRLCPAPRRAAGLVLSRANLVLRRAGQTVRSKNAHLRSSQQRHVEQGGEGAPPWIRRDSPLPAPPPHSQRRPRAPPRPAPPRPAPPCIAQDWRDIDMAVEAGVDFVALSFCKTADAVQKPEELRG